MSRKWGWMGSFKDEVSGAIDVLSLLLCICPPEQEYEVRTPLIQLLYDPVSKLLPPPTRMRTGLVGLNGENCIEQENPLTSPPLKTPV